MTRKYKVKSPNSVIRGFIIVTGIQSSFTAKSANSIQAKEGVLFEKCARFWGFGVGVAAAVGEGEKIRVRPPLYYRIHRGHTKDG